jgi:hypothetical protein
MRPLGQNLVGGNLQLSVKRRMYASTLFVGFGLIGLAIRVTFFFAVTRPKSDKQIRLSLASARIERKTGCSG